MMHAADEQIAREIAQRTKEAIAAAETRAAERLSARIAPLEEKLASLQTELAVTHAKLSSMPLPKDGAHGKDGRDGLDGKNGADGKDGRDGVGVDRVEIEPDGSGFDLVLSDGTRASIPLQRGPKGDQGPNGKDGRDGIDGKDGARGQDGQKGDRGEMGPNGADGHDGKDADPLEMRAEVERVVRAATPELLVKLMAAAMPDIVQRAALLVPRGENGADGRDGANGANGEDGRDGMSPDDFDVQLDGRTLTLGLRCGDRVVSRQVKLAGLPDYKGIYSPGQHELGDMVTYGGSIWRAKRDTTEPPKGLNDHWQLVVKGGK